MSLDPRGEPNFDGHLTDINNAQGEAETRNALKITARDHRLTESQKDALMQHGRAKLGLMAVAALAPHEHYGKGGLTIESGKGGGGSTLESAIPSSVSQTELAPAPDTATEIVLPFVNAEAMSQAIDAWGEVARAIERPEDLCTIQGKLYRKVSFWRKVRMAYRITVQSMPGKIDPVAMTSEAHIRLIAPNGAFVDATGYCSGKEKLMVDAPLHNIIAKSETRAFARGMRTLIGFGEPSAEEVDGDAD